MASKIKGITITLGADVQPLNKALEGVNKKSRDLQSELKQVDRLLKLDPKNTELLKQKQDLLTQAVGNTKDKLDTLKEAEKQAQQQFKNGEIGEEQYRAIQREVASTEQNLKGLEKQLKEVNNGWKNAAEGLDKFGKKATDIGKNMSTKVTLPIAAAGAVAFKTAADLEDAFGATEQIFKGASDEVKAWADSIESYYGIAEGEALEYANTMGAMLKNIGGLSEEEAAKQSATLVELAGDLSAMFGGTTESAVQALTGALKGNNTMLDNYGMGVNDATIKAKAFEMGLYDGKGQMELSVKQAATLALVMEQTADAQGQAAREADGASGTMKAFATEVKNLAGEFGEQLLPIITPIISKLKDMMERFGDLSPGAKKVIIVVGLIVAAIGPLLLFIGTLATGLSSIITIAPLVGGAMAGMLGPILIVIGIVVALIAIGVLLYENWDTIKEKAGQLKDWLGEKWTEIKDKTTETFNNIKDAILAPIHAAREGIRLAIDKIKGFFSFEWKFPKIKLPHFSVSWTKDGFWGKVGDIIGLPGKPKLAVDWYKDGAIFTQPTLFNTRAGVKGVGEAGAEAVLPISRLDGIMASALNKAGVGGMSGAVIHNYMVVDGEIMAKSIQKIDQSNIRRYELQGG